MIICYFTFLGKGHENRISLSRPRDMHTSWSLRMDPTWLSSLPRVLGPPGPGSRSPTVRSRGAPEGRTGRPRHQHPPRPSQRRPSPARLFPVSPGTPSPCHWPRPLGGPSSARPKGPPLPAGLPRSRFGLWFWEGAFKLPVTVSHPRATVPPRPAPRPWGGGTGARGHGGGADSRVPGLSMKAKSFDREFAFPVPRAEGGAAPLALSAGRRGEPARGPAPRR